jgi:hypothetical protein
VEVEFSKLCLSMTYEILKGPLIKYFISGPFLYIVSCSPAIDKIVANQ